MCVLTVLESIKQKWLVLQNDNQITKAQFISLSRDSFPTLLRQVFRKELKSIKRAMVREGFHNEKR
jgi:endonuclease YncB( thermonuclease family)